MRSRKIVAWNGCIDLIAEQLFWDMDFLDEETFADLDPVQSAHFKKRARIDDDYFSTPPPLVREEDYREADRFIRTAAGCPELLDPWNRDRS